MKTFAVALCVILAVASIGATLTLSGITLKTSSVNGTYANSQVDTLTWVRGAQESGATFWVSAKDSLAITDVILRRQFQGGLATVIAGDTLLGSTTSTANTGTIKYATITLLPYCDTLKIFVTYTSSGNGVTSPIVQYGVAKKF
jgi:hypothetical protein